jgi:very-short-patch-repair endonuclease
MQQDSRGSRRRITHENGRRFSLLQVELQKLVGGILNHRVGRHAVDLAIVSGGPRVAIEYDSWYWHAGCEAKDKARDQALLAAGWRVLRIRSGGQVPSAQELRRMILELRKSPIAVRVHTSEDWGVGPRRADLLRRRAVGRSNARSQPRS